MMSWGSIVLCVGVVLAVWFAWSTYCERQARPPAHPHLWQRPTPDLHMLRDADGSRGPQGRPRRAAALGRPSARPDSCPGTLCSPTATSHSSTD